MFGFGFRFQEVLGVPGSGEEGRLPEMCESELGLGFLILSVWGLLAQFKPSTQRLQYSLIKEYCLNYSRTPNMI